MVEEIKLEDTSKKKGISQEVFRIHVLGMLIGVMFGFGISGLIYAISVQSLVGILISAFMCIAFFPPRNADQLYKMYSSVGRLFK